MLGSPVTFLFLQVNRPNQRTAPLNGPPQKKSSVLITENVRRKLAPSQKKILPYQPKMNRYLTFCQRWADENAFMESLIDLNN